MNAVEPGRHQPMIRRQAIAVLREFACGVGCLVASALVWGAVLLLSVWYVLRVAGVL